MFELLDIKPLKTITTHSHSHHSWKTTRKNVQPVSPMRKVDLADPWEATGSAGRRDPRPESTLVKSNLCGRNCLGNFMTFDDQGFEASLVVQDCVHQLYVCASC